MSSFTMVMLEEGVDLEVPAELSELVGILDREVPWFSCDGYGYCLSSAKGTLRDHWMMVVKLADLSTREPYPDPLGCVKLENLGDGMVRLNIPPRSQQEVPCPEDVDPDGRLFGSFIYQVINTCQRLELIHLPGFLPTI